MFLRAASDFDWQSEVFIIVHGSYSFGLFFFRITTLVISRLTNELDKRNTISCIQSIYRDWSQKFETGLNGKIGIDQKMHV